MSRDLSPREPALRRTVILWQSALAEEESFARTWQIGALLTVRMAAVRRPGVGQCSIRIYDEPRMHTRHKMNSNSSQIRSVSLEDVSMNAHIHTGRWHERWEETTATLLRFDPRSCCNTALLLKNLDVLHR